MNTNAELNFQTSGSRNQPWSCDGWRDWVKSRELRDRNALTQQVVQQTVLMSGDTTAGDVFLEMRHSKTKREGNLGTISHSKLKNRIYLSTLILGYLANRAYCGLQNHMKSRIISRNTKTLLYKTLIRPALTYGAETWVLSKQDEHRLSIFERIILSRRPFCAVALRRTAWSEHGMGAAWQVWNQTRPH